MSNIEILGQSVSGLPLIAHSFPKTNLPKVLVVAGVHGDEIEGVALARGLLQSLLKDPSELDLDLFLIPEVNPDGVLNKTRVNANGVDLNRNLPTQDWSPEAFNERYPPGPFAGSEPENKMLMQILDRLQPTLVISLHSFTPVLNINGDCHSVAKAIATHTNAPLSESMGYPTPGCLGTYAGLERAWPTLTYEVDRGWSIDQVLKIHLPALIQGLKTHADNMKG